VTVWPWVFLAAAVGVLWGFFADRLAARWPEHEAGVEPRGLDWRTAVVTLSGGLAFGALAARWQDPVSFLVLLPFAAALVVLLATDLDQRLLPDLITLPMIVAAAVVLVGGWSPLLAGKDFPLVSGIAAAIGLPLFLFVTDRVLHGALGAGDLKLAVSIGLLAGVTRIFIGFLVASVVFAAILLVLMASRRLGLRTAIPFGPALIGATFVAMVLG
jgi:leader peptidase (prepilin peptidase)/N-methyltransferase